MYMMPTVYSVPNSYIPDITMSASWNLPEEPNIGHSMVNTANTANTTSGRSGLVNGNSTVEMSMAAADRERNQK